MATSFEQREQEVKAYKQHLETQVNNMLDNFEKDDYEYDNAYDVTIQFKGKSITLELHADLYNNLLNILDEELE